MSDHDQHPTNLDRVAVFIDYSNVQRSALSVFHAYGTSESRGQVDPLITAQLLVSRRHRPSRLVEVSVYRGQPGLREQPGAAAASARQASLWQQDPRVRVKQLPLTYASQRGHPPQEKGIDVSLAIDLVCADGRDYDVAILFSRDRDLLPAVQAVHRRRAVHLEVATWEGTSRLRLPEGNLPWCHYLDDADYRAVADSRRYLTG
ncbi:NYN domain-containing protein (plasmid) [Pseudonocardia bannensis]|uniref:NYN domain-containing protein n=1 Tax=Pseudonocardia bannensis TaxID=630973 RepID=A0A848DL85_9PSEU|nr:NYN domain-containing protein [Pseudonocardia bannensis]NMH93507.1 NYN domain-containing protein [Pseudonocardia bannensis]